MSTVKVSFAVTVAELSPSSRSSIIGDTAKLRTVPLFLAIVNSASIGVVLPNSKTCLTPLPAADPVYQIGEEDLWTTTTFLVR